MAQGGGNIENGGTMGGHGMNGQASSDEVSGIQDDQEDDEDYEKEYTEDQDEDQELDTTVTSFHQNNSRYDYGTDNEEEKEAALYDQ